MPIKARNSPVHEKLHGKLQIGRNHRRNRKPVQIPKDKQEEENKQHIKIPNINLQKQERKIKKNSVILLKKNKMETLTLHHHGILTQKLWKLKRHVTQNRTEKEQKLAHSKLAQTYVTPSQNLSSNRTAGCSRKPAQTSAAGSHCLSHKSQQT